MFQVAGYLRGNAAPGYRRILCGVLLGMLWAVGPAALPALGYTFIQTDGNGNPVGWKDENTSTPATIDVYYDFRSETYNGTTYANQITAAQEQVVVTALSDLSAITGNRLVFTHSTSASRNNIINIGMGNLAAAGGVNDNVTLGLGGAQWDSYHDELYAGIAWLSNSFTWDTTIGNGNVSSAPTSADFYTVVIHEILHAIGLNHSESSKANIMNATDYGEKFGPAQDDINGVQYLYGSNITASQAYTAVNRTISGDMYIGPLAYYDYFEGNPSNFYEYVDAGNFIVTGTTYIRASNSYSNPAFFQQDGGTWQHANLQIGGPGRAGTLTLNGGTLTATTLAVNTLGTLIQNGGALSAGTMSVAAGQTFTQNGGATTAGALINNGSVVQHGASATFGQVTGTGSLDLYGAVSARSVRQQSVTIESNARLALLTASTPTVSAVGTLVVNGQLDLANNTMVVSTTAGNADSTYATLLTKVMAGRNGGSWDGSTGITSSTAHAAYVTNGVETQAVALVKNSDLVVPKTSLADVSLQPSNLILMVTLIGDVDLDGQITTNDYLRMDQGLLYQKSGWAYGDVNYDGVVNYQDFAAVDKAAQALGETALADSMIALHSAWFGAPYLAAIPEPASGGLLLLGAVALLRKRRGVNC